VNGGRREWQEKKGKTEKEKGKEGNHLAHYLAHYLAILYKK
jgi:hypothetical protein